MATAPEPLYCPASTGLPAAASVACDYTESGAHRCGKPRTACAVESHRCVCGVEWTSCTTDHLELVQMAQRRPDRFRGETK